MNKVLENIEILLFEDENFQKIRSIANKNHRSLFHIIAKEYDELTFSRVLQYFLDPNEDHKLGDFILKEFIHSFIKGNSVILKDISINRLSIETIELKKSKVYREYSLGKFGRLDIFIEIENQLLLIIECKMLSPEGNQQTNRYSEWINQNHKENIPILMCFLTPDGSSAESDSFLPLSYSEIYEIFDNQYVQNNLNEENLYLANNFKKWINGFMEQNEEVRQLCRTLYSKYKQEFDLIYSSMPTFKSFYSDLTENIKNQYSSEYLAHYGSYWMTISPKSWIGHESLRESSKYTLPRFQIINYGDKQYFTLVGPQTGKLTNYIKEKSELHFEQNIILKSYKDWGKLYYPFEIFESFNPETIINDWNKIISEYTTKSIEYMKKIEKFLPENKLLELLQ